MKNTNENTMEAYNIINEKMLKEINVLINYAQQEGITIDKYTMEALNFSSVKTDVTLFFDEYDLTNNELNSDAVTLTYDKENKLINIARKIENKNNIVTVGDNPMTSYTRYQRNVEQKVTEYKVNDGKLDITTASLFQSIKEDTMGGGDWIIVNFKSIADFKDEEHLKWVQHAASMKISEESYDIPEDYKLEDGIESVVSMPKTNRK